MASSSEVFGWIDLVMRILFEYGPKLWAFIKEIMEELHKDSKQPDLQKLETFRQAVARQWRLKKGVWPTHKQIEVAFLDAASKVA